MKIHRRQRATIAGCLGFVLTGCAGAPMRPRFDPVPLGVAAAIVNDNISNIRGTLRASGTADGHVTQQDGRRRTFHLDAVLFYLAPACFRFDLKKLGKRQILFGSNSDYHWFYTAQDDAYTCCRQGASTELAPELPVHPKQMVHALGLTPISGAMSGDRRAQPVQRVVDDYQQILFLKEDDTGALSIEREYWLDRRPPSLVRRVIFRDSDGVPEMVSCLDDYRQITKDGPWLPHDVIAEWPKTAIKLHFRVGSWRVIEQIGPDGVQFATPSACAGD